MNKPIKIIDAAKRLRHHGILDVVAAESEESPILGELLRIADWSAPLRVAPTDPEAAPTTATPMPAMEWKLVSKKP
jgi:hypothetical protein